jgi:tryptophan-rich sensory protein
LVVTSIAATVGAMASARAPLFYAQLERPSWAPPASWFGPVWTVLYALMGFAAWLVWRERKQIRVQVAIALFVVQLVFNALWTWIFFAWRQGALAFVEMVILLWLIIATSIAFWRVSKLAAALLIPYLAWVGFATALTWFVWQANPVLLE